MENTWLSGKNIDCNYQKKKNHKAYFTSRDFTEILLKNIASLYLNCSFKKPNEVFGFEINTALFTAIKI